MATNRWRQIAERVLRMDRVELRDRLRQEVAKRQDSLLAKVGYDFAGRAQVSAHAAPGHFFFGAHSIEPILTLMRQRLPGQAEWIVQQAEKICSHRFDLLGYKDLEYGVPIDWHLDAVHRTRAPGKAFYRIDYLNFAEVGDSKVTWELNRHQHFVTLAKAARLTGERRFADEILSQWRHWTVENPYPTGINWASSLEVAFRSLSWIWTCELLRGSREAADLRTKLLHGLAVHGRHIERYLSTYFSPNTHLLGEGVALFFLGVTCPELAEVERWKTLGWSMVLEEMERQVAVDGFHFEQSTYYHVYALDFFLHSAVLASLNNIAIPQRFEEKLERMLNALMLLGRGGPPPRFGDDDGGRVFDPRRNRSEHLMDPLSTGAILFQREDFKRAAGELREETLWLLGAEGVRRWDALEIAPPSQESAALEESGLYLLPGTTISTQLAVQTGPLKAESVGHAHAGRLSVCLSHGNALLIDPGTYAYLGPGGERDLFRGTAMHSTVRVDGVDQADPAGPFSWREFPQSNVEQWIQGERFDLLVASHDGYQRLPEPVTHRRFVVSLRDGNYLIRDVVEGKGKHRIEISWHLAPELQLVEHGLYRVKAASHGLALLTPEAHGWAEEVRRESWSPVYGEKAPMTVLTFSADLALPAEFATLLVTLEVAHRRPGSFSRINTAQAELSLAAYKYTSGQEECCYVFANPCETWRMNQLASDAEVVCWRRASQDSHNLLMCNGSFAALDGGMQIRCLEPVAWAEEVVKDGQRTVYSSNSGAIAEDTAVVHPAASATPASES